MSVYMRSILYIRRFHIVNPRSKLSTFAFGHRTIATSVARLATESKVKSNEAASKAYSDTLLLPKTNFPLRADAAKREITFRKRCTEDLYLWQLEHNPKELFILHDGPPYANGNLHIGWDCHGLPIELKALSELKADGTVLSPMEIRKIARECALKAIETQRQDFMSWGIIGDWDNTYRTLDKEYEVRQLKVFHAMVKKGYIYRQNKPVYWSPSSRTALAEAELEYRDDHESRSVYVKFPVDKFSTSLSGIIPENNSIFALIWTTTPWTLPANQAVAINPKIIYSIVKVDFTSNKEYCIVAKERLNTLQQILGFESFDFIAEFPGSALIGTEYKHPITKNLHNIIAASHVTSESGTGLVHIAPGHGMDDYEACRELNLATFCPVDDFGRFTSEVGESSFEGKAVLTEGTTAVIEYLNANNILLKEQKYTHKYPYDWRTKKPIILRATSQWFANVKDIQQKAIMSLANVKMYPESALHRLESFIKSRNEWCISRQRSWGVPIPVLYESETDVALLTDSSVQHIIEIIKMHGSDGWWTSDEQELVAPEYRDNGITYKRGIDTMDVWFDSGVSWTLIEEMFKRSGNEPVADLYLEGSDQHRGWFQSSLLTSIAVSDKPPYSTIITHGFILDEKGRKMSKSLGNVVEPKTITQGGKNRQTHPPYGTDILRLLVASSEYTKDVNIGKTFLSQVIDNMRKYRNTARFMLGNLNDFNYKDQVETESLKPIDRYLQHQLYHFGEQVNQAYAEFSISHIVQALNNFTNANLSAFYFEIVKDRLYADHAGSLSRRAVQTVLYQILNVYTLSLAPIVPHLAEEIYENYKIIGSIPHNSVFQLGWYHLEKEWNNPSIASEFEILKDLRSEVNYLLEMARQDK
ncbi:11034_t:CDS:10 [Ambispora leptoticha]|uniref:isoleucine--tRNA ligase n=1 Tax=Ambispora leptoticha TaxID=144679 RepID=A0A9N8WTS5_9GLOM|nr:11034_t:CDS:10 [Ambispora leptoticha]